VTASLPQIHWRLGFLILVLSAITQRAGAQVSIRRLGSFQTPSGNIHCEQWRVGGRQKTELRCDVLNSTAPRPTPPKDCELDYGYAFMLGERRKGWLLCGGDTIVDSSHTVLAYGAAWRGAGVSCDVTQERLRCTNRDGRGFTLSRGRQQLF
jgi:hypothetical protein